MQPSSISSQVAINRIHGQNATEVSNRQPYVTTVIISAYFLNEFRVNDWSFCYLSIPTLRRPTVRITTS